MPEQDTTKKSPFTTGANVTGRYHDGVGVVIGPSKGYEGTDLVDVRFPTGTPGTGRGGVVKQYSVHDLSHAEAR